MGDLSEVRIFGNGHGLHLKLEFAMYLHSALDSYVTSTACLALRITLAGRGEFVKSPRQHAQLMRKLQSGRVQPLHVLLYNRYSAYIVCTSTGTTCRVHQRLTRFVYFHRIHT
jgi:hypothetical protein